VEVITDRLEGKVSYAKTEEAFSKIDADGLVRFVQELVRIPTPNPPGNEQPVAERVVDEMRRIGLKTMLQDVAPKRPNVIGILKGEIGMPALLIESHMDTVPVGERNQWTVDPFSAEIRDGKIYGRGSGDNKSGVGIVVESAKAIVRAGIKVKRDVIFTSLVDEEGLMRGVKYLIKSGVTKNVTECIAADGWTSQTLRTQFCGQTFGYIHVYGRTGHAAAYPPSQIGLNAIHQAAKLVQRISDSEPRHTPHPMFGHSHWQCLRVEGGWDPTHAFVVPDKVTIAVDASLVPGHDPDDVWRQMQEILDDMKQEDPQFNAEVEVVEKRPSWTISGNEPLMQAIAAAYQQVNGIPPRYDTYPENPAKWIMNIHWLAYEGIKCQPLVALKPPFSESFSHRANEYTKIDDLINATKVMISAILRLCT
jgi:succinyl-diaminopimelate desuccinylase